MNSEKDFSCASPPRPTTAPVMSGDYSDTAKEFGRTKDVERIFSVKRGTHVCNLPTETFKLASHGRHVDLLADFRDTLQCFACLSAAIACIIQVFNNDLCFLGDRRGDHDCFQ